MMQVGSVEAFPHSASEPKTPPLPVAAGFRFHQPIMPAYDAVLVVVALIVGFVLR